MYSAQNQFPVITQAERMIDRTVKLEEEITGIAEERNSSSAQIRTLFDEQRRTIIAECCEKVSHHELQAARAEQERKILQEELRRQQQDFREAHQQNVTEMKELRKFQSSAFDTLTRQKFIEDQNTYGIISPSPAQEFSARSDPITPTVPVSSRAVRRLVLISNSQDVRSTVPVMD